MTGYRLRIRITKVPEGEAPEVFRRAWVGLHLPANRHSGEGRIGIVSKHPLPDKPGFVVPAAEAITVLSGVNPEAAEWFNRYAWMTMLFGHDEAEVVSES